MWQLQAKALIKEFEGLSLKTYKCLGGCNTIGYGHVIKNTTEDALFKNGIDASEAETLLLNDMNIANQALVRLVSVPLNSHQRAALVSFVFNVGSGAFQASTLRQKLNRGEYNPAAEQFLKWIHGGGRQLPGLVRRRHAERELFLREDQLAAPSTAKPKLSVWQQLAAFFADQLKR